MREIIYDTKFVSQFDPLDKNTIDIERKLGLLEILPTGLISGARAFKGNKLPRNTGALKINQHTVLVRAEGEAITVYCQARAGNDLDKLINKF